jgi:hypothetical protein
VHAISFSLQGLSVMSQASTLFFFGRALASHHVVTVMTNPFFCLAGVGESFRVDRWRQWRNDLADTGVFAYGGGHRVMAGSTTPFLAVFGGKHLLTARRLGWCARLRGVAGQLSGRCDSVNKGLSAVAVKANKRRKGLKMCITPL